MTKTVTLLSVAIFLLTYSISGIAQSAKEEIDPSKPTNFYTQFFSNLELNTLKGEVLTYGYRGNLQFASANGTHLLLAEIPMLYNERTNKFGLSDIRLRYFGIAYKDYSKFFCVVAPSLDVFIPSGKYVDGLGSSRLKISPGVAFGFMFADWIQTFPVFSYQLQSKAMSDEYVGENTLEHGFTIQAITPIKLSKTTTLELTPWIIINNVDQPKKDDFLLVARLYKVIKNKYQVGAFNLYHFGAKRNTFRVFFVLFI